MVNGSGAGGSYADRMARPIAQVAVVLAAFGLGAALAGVFGAESLGIALSFGQLAFTLALGFVLLRA
jgi:hypothetical protein